jgi:hypothetical protein
LVYCPARDESGIKEEERFKGGNGSAAVCARAPLIFKTNSSTSFRSRQFLSLRVRKSQDTNFLITSRSISRALFTMCDFSHLSACLIKQPIKRVFIFIAAAAARSRLFYAPWV